MHDPEASTADWYRQFFENVREAAMLWEVMRDEAGELVDLVVLEVNGEGLARFGKPLGELRGRTVTQLYDAATVSLMLDIARQVMGTGKPHQGQLQFPWTDGIRHVLSSEFRLDHHLYVTTGVDVTALVRAAEDRDRAETQLQQTQVQLLHAQKMEAVGRLAGAVAHDFNNLLSVILSYSDLLIKELRPTEPMRVDLQEIHKAGVRAAALTRQLLAFSRQQVLDPRVLSLNDVLAGMDRMLRRLVGEEVALQVVADPQLRLCVADPGQLEQVVMNLAVNARDAMAEGGRLTLETQNVFLDEQYTHLHPEAQIGWHVMLAATDTGVGMDKATQARIFEPFFTTKPKDKGTGLGLSTVFGVVRQSGGTIWVYSEPGRGSSFKIYLPVSEKSERAPPPPPLPLASTRGTETILLAEDEDQVRQLVRNILVGAGYHVLEAKNAGEALLIAEQHDGRIDLLVTDVVMPRMSGRELAERLSKLRPSMKVLYASGYTEHAILREGFVDSGITFLQKPITPDALLQKVRQVLEQPCPGP